MATRYCGAVRIDIRYIDADCQYACKMALLTVLNGTIHVGTVYVGEPAVLVDAVDSPKAYDNVAHAAMSFSTDKESGLPCGSDIEQRAAYTNTASGWAIRRKR